MASSLSKSIATLFSKHITKHTDHSLRLFLARTISAQLHVFGFFLALGFSTTLLLTVHQRSSSLESSHWISALVFSATGLMVFASSSALHFLADGFQISAPARNILRLLDHSSIYLFIAGCYTVFVLNTIKAPWDAYVLTLVWSTALLGMLYTALKSRLPKALQNRWVSTGLFLALGWTVLIILPEAWSALDGTKRGLLVLGGLSYTLGAFVYASQRPDPIPKVFGHHEIWHIAVLFGFCFHSTMILKFYL